MRLFLDTANLGELHRGMNQFARDHARAFQQDPEAVKPAAAR